MQDYQRGLALVATECYPEALAAFEVASQAGCGVATFELAMAYDWLYYGTYQHPNPRAYGRDCLHKAAYEQAYIPARAHLVTREYDEHFGAHAFAKDMASDAYLRLRFACYNGNGFVRQGWSTAAQRDALYRMCIERNLPVPADLAFCLFGIRIPPAERDGIIHLAQRGMPWAQFLVGINGNDSDPYGEDCDAREKLCMCAARNGHFQAAYSLRTQSVEMFERALYLDWFVAPHRRLMFEPGSHGLLTVGYMRQRYYRESRFNPLSAEEIYCFGRAAHRLLHKDANNPDFDFWHRLRTSYLSCMLRVRKTCAAFMVAAKQKGMPRDVARYIAHCHIWPQRAHTATHKDYALKLMRKKMRK